MAPADDEQAAVPEAETPDGGAAGAADDPAVDAPAAKAPEAEAAAVESDSPDAAAATAPPPAPAFNTLEAGLRRLPPYAQSLLKIKVPVKVTLATARRPINKILELGPGAIIQFKKSCDDTLTLEVGEHKVAQGEAVKVGDKFGLWITSMVLPEERFWSVRPQSGGTRVK